MENTPNLSLPYLMPSQAQKHVTHNEALDLLDALVQIAVLDKDIATPPATPGDGDRYIVAATPTGDWAGQAGKIAVFRDGGWSFLQPRAGWHCFLADDLAFICWTGSAWKQVSETIETLQNLTLFGVGTTADSTNPFSAKINKALWTALSAAEGGTGDLRYTLNKEGSGNILSILLQSGFGGRAELGLLGNDDLTLKVSADGSTWNSAMVVDRSTGHVQATGLAATVDIQTFAAAGTWTKPANAKLVQVTCIGGGGGGGGGPKVAASSSASGGGGGGGGTRIISMFNASALPATVSVIIGAGGAGGAGATSTGDGSNGSGPGGDTIFGASLASAYVAAHGGGSGGGGGAGRASGGGGGAGRNQAGGNANGATAGASGTGGGMAGATGGGNGLYQINDFGGGGGASSHQVTGAAGGGGATLAGPGGGAGGGFSTANTALVGAGVLTAFSTGMTGSSGIGGAAPGGGGSNGGGGASSTSGDGGNGGNGILPGQGGGGGGASQAGNGGNGGTGASGQVTVVTYF